MKIDSRLKSFFSKKNILSIFFCVILTLVIVALFNFVKSFYIFRDTRGYDYDELINAGYDWTGPKIGEKIQLNYLKNGDGISLPQKLTHSKTLISVVDPECFACQAASDQMKYINEKLANSDVNYAVVSFSQKMTNKKLSEYVESLELDADSFLWTDKNENILSSINSMVLPSHILIDAEGNVITTYPGTDKEKSIRDRMANQIIKEILQSHETILQ